MSPPSASGQGRGGILSPPSGSGQSRSGKGPLNLLDVPRLGDLAALAVPPGLARLPAPLAAVRLPQPRHTAQPQSVAPGKHCPLIGQGS